MLSLLIYLIVIVILYAVAYYVVNQLLPEPARKIANVVLIALAAIVVCVMLMNFVGSGSLTLPRLR